jgi:hypothetical protein
MKRFFRKPPHSPATPDPEPQIHEIRRLDIASMIDLAIEVWRLEERLKRMSASIGKDDPASVFAAEKIRDIFSQIGIEIRDLTGQPYNEGMSLDVLTRDYPADEHPPYRIIQETISPAVFLDGELKKLAQVIIGKAGDPDHGKTDH